MTNVRSAVLVVLALTACGPAEIRIDETKGVPSVKGDTEITISATFTCGEAIPAGDKMVATRVVTGGCEFTFDDTLQVLSASDYEVIGDLKVTSNLVQRVELTIKKLAFVDGATGAALDINTRVTSVVLSVNGQKVADKAAITSLPAVVSLEGAALTALKAKVDARQPASVAVKAVAVLPDMPRPPERLKIDYEAQPALILGPGKIF
ncbi:MAG: hypothetical protein Q8K32_17605 [Archangium sp.]|nr:hypothetical protein [Archangium sp.]MDP3570280.1 hypothetical protein [Archangium sp.]